MLMAIMPFARPAARAWKKSKKGSPFQVARPPTGLLFTSTPFEQLEVDWTSVVFLITVLLLLVGIVVCRSWIWGGAGATESCGEVWCHYDLMKWFIHAYSSLEMLVPLGKLPVWTRDEF